MIGGFALAKVRYDQCLRFVAPLLLVLVMLCTTFLAVGATVA